jgi:Zn-dependent peptidase ImmA (M78 family)
LIGTRRADLAKAALERSLEVREEYGYDFRTPLCVFGLASRARVKVQFVDDVSMEGFYAAFARPTILLSSLRPLVRRVFNCAHELGHHFFDHGSTIDELQERARQRRFEPNEFLADAFGGYLLMPAQGMKRAFSLRGLAPTTAGPGELYAVASSFGVGYETIVDHLTYSLQVLPAERARDLHKVGLPEIRETILGVPTTASLVIADKWYLRDTVDVEVGNLILVPHGASSDSAHIERLGDVSTGSVFRAVRPGLSRVHVADGTWAVVVRVSRYQYAGLAQYRHLEECEDD